MTKCHLFFLTASVLLLFSCKPSQESPSLSDYGAKSQATQRLLFEKYVLELLDQSPERAWQMQDSLLESAACDSARWQQLTALEEHFLLDPNSPYRNEELYIPVVEHLLASPFTSEKQRTYAAWIRTRLQLNRPGQKAGDFEFVTPKGRRTSLFATIDAHRPQQTLLFFSNPDCDNCKEIAEALSRNPAVRKKLHAAALLIVNIYPDEDVQTWLGHLHDYPEEWICGYDADQRLNSGTLYWLRAIPSLYLLDSEKRVILKDATLERILSALSY